MSNDTNQSMHCKACDALYYAVWYEEEKRFEELCPTCISKSGLSIDDDPIADMLEHMEKNGFVPDGGYDYE